MLQTLQSTVGPSPAEARVASTAGPLVSGKFAVDAASDSLRDADAGTSAVSSELNSVQTQYSKLMAVKEDQARLAEGVRALDETKRLVERVAESLEIIVKSFPPFPPGGLEREQFLNSVAGIRAMIERLTLPPQQGEAVNATLSLPAFKDASADDAQLAEAQSRVGELFRGLGEARGRLGEAVGLGETKERDDARHVELSRQVGRALLESRLSIGLAPAEVVGQALKAT